MRKLVTIRSIDEVLPIEGADAIVIVKIDGWQCVALKEEFGVGDLCVYFEIDSFIPITPAVEHLRARAFRRMVDKEGIRIKTIKLRGQLSQGLALPVTKFPEVKATLARLYDEHAATGGGPISMTERMENVDWTEVLGVEKWELPIPSELAGKVRGNFPSFIPKTAQERCQNIVRNIFEKHKDTLFEVTMKVDGTSFTAYRFDEQAGVCSRTMDLELSEWNAGNSLVRMYIDSGLHTALAGFGRNLAVQGELVGPGIQRNHEGQIVHHLFVFDIYDIDRDCYLPAIDRYNVMQELYARGLKKDMVDHAPMLTKKYSTLAELGITNIAELLAYADGPNNLNILAIREGVVFKSFDGTFSFKVISNKYLLKEVDVQAV